MLEAPLIASGMMLGLTTLALVVAGRWPLRWRLFRALVGLLLGLVAGTITGQVRPDAPSTFVTAATILLSLAMPRRWWAIGAVAFASLLVATAVYLVYLAQVTLVLANSAPALLLGLILLAIELGAIGLMTAAVFEMLDALCRPVTMELPLDPPARWPTVCLQVPAHQEPPDLVIETIHSLIALDYPRDALLIQVIDNNTTDEGLWHPLQAECERLRDIGWRITFVHLADWPGYKAGALNWGREQLPADVEVVGVVDADYVVDPPFLRATVPYFVDPSVGFVQTPQEYRAWQDSAFYRACHTGFAYFFRVGMVSRSYRNSIIFAGTMGLIRRTTLDAIGGWDEAIITEDAETSLRILARGERGVYVPRAYGRGIMPLTYEALRGQRFRWAFGGIQILRKHWRALLPWSDSDLTQRQRRDYPLGGLWWFNDALTLAFAAFVAATAVGAITGHPFVVQRLTGLGIILPLLYIALGLVRYLWGLRVATRVELREAVDAMRVNLSLSWVITLACVRALIEERGVFLRTPKFRGSDRARELRVVVTETALGAASALLAIGVLVTAGLSLLTLTLGTLLGWSTLIYGSATSFALGDPTRPPVALRQKAGLEVGPRIERALRRTSFQAGTAGALALGLVVIALLLAGEAGRSPVSGGSPFQGQLLAPIERRSALPSPSPGPTPTPSPSPSPTSTPAPSPSPSPSPTATPVPSPSPSPSATSVVRSRPSPSPSPTSVLRSRPAPTPTPTTSPT